MCKSYLMKKFLHKFVQKSRDFRIRKRHKDKKKTISKAMWRDAHIDKKKFRMRWPLIKK